MSKITHSKCFLFNYSTGTKVSRLFIQSAIIKSDKVYQQVLRPGHAVYRRQTQSNRDEAQHWLPDQRGPAFGLCWPIWVLLFLWGQSLDRSVAEYRLAILLWAGGGSLQELLIVTLFGSLRVLWILRWGVHFHHVMWLLSINICNNINAVTLVWLFNFHKV